MRTSALHVIALLVMPGLASAASFTPLGHLPDYAYSSYGYGVSADGSVAVGMGTDGHGNTMAFRWTSATGIQPIGGADSFAFGVSTDGATVVGGWANNKEAFRWTSATGAVGLCDFDGGDFSSVANAVSADGAIVVGNGTASPGLLNGQAFRWTADDGMAPLPGVAQPYSNASDITPDGTVIVGRQDGAGVTEAFRWTEAGGAIGLGCSGQGFPGQWIDGHWSYHAASFSRSA